MRIEYAASSGDPYGQFVVYADTPQDRAILDSFLQAGHNHDWTFWRHGASYKCDGLGPYAFNFGWIKTPGWMKKNLDEACRAAGCLLATKPRMLFLDDRAKRVESARRQFGEKWDLTIVSNVKECLRKMSEEDWDEVHLDHDLNGEDFQDPDEPTAGMAVVRYLEKCGWPANKKKPIFRVHSSNVFAAWAMVKRLQVIGLYAFWDRFQYEESK